MGLYDDPEVVGQEAAEIARQQNLAGALAALGEKLLAARSLGLSDTRPAARTQAMEPILAKVEEAAGKAGTPTPENARRLEELRKIVSDARAEEANAELGRRAEELALLREQLALRLEEVRGGLSLPSVAGAHLRACAR